MISVGSDSIGDESISSALRAAGQTIKKRPREKEINRISNESFIFWTYLSEESELSTCSTVSFWLALFLFDKEHPPSPHAKTGAVVKEKANIKGRILFISTNKKQINIKPFSESSFN